MSRDEAITLVEMLIHGWPGAAWEVPKMEAYIESLLPLDAAVTTKAILRARDKLRFRPSIAELREFIQLEQRASSENDWRLMPVIPPGRPEWVERWTRARARNDLRPFPEQLTALNKLAQQSSDAYAAYNPPTAPLTDRSAWIQPDEYLT